MKGVLKPKRYRWLMPALYLFLPTLLVVSLLEMAQMIMHMTLPSGTIDLATSQVRYTVGDDVAFTITNRVNAPIYITNTCPSEPLSVYRYQNGQWQPIHATTDVRNCPEETRQIAIPANSSVTGSYHNWGSLFSQPGVYRIEMTVEHYDARPYQDFVMMPQPVAAQSTPTTQGRSSTSATPTQSNPTTTPQTQSAPRGDRYEPGDD